MLLAQVPGTSPSAQQASPFEQLPLRDIHLPAEPSLWPLAPGWWVLVGIAVLILAFLVWQLAKKMKRRAFVRRVLAMLDTRMAAAGNNGAKVAAEVSMLLRRAALTRYPKQEVASLSGEPWLGFLDRTGGNGAFSTGAGRVLADGPWRPQAQVDAPQLKAVARRWLEANL